MKLLIGLGNPGAEYVQTRHNVGFMFVDWLAAQHKAASFAFNKKFFAELTEITIDGQKIILAKPQTYMNESGRAVSALLNFYKLTPADLTIIHDDLDISLGNFKIQTGKGPKVHNGVNSVEEALGTVDFQRIRIGVENRGENRTPGERYVLESFAKEDLKLLEDMYSPIAQSLANSLEM